MTATVPVPSVANPYRKALARARSAAGFDAVPLLSVLGGALAAGLVRDEVFDFAGGLSSGTPMSAAAAAGLVGRIGLLLGAGLTLGTFDVVVRGPDRAVLDTHPLLPGPWYISRITESARVRLPWLLAALAALWPLGDLRAIALCGFVLAGAWFAGLGVGIGVNLAAPAVGLDPRYTGVLDAIRGVNPRLQAALLYAPGVALGIAGGGILAGASGLDGALRGSASFAWLLAPWALGAVGIVLGRRAAPNAARLPALLGEIDAAYAFADAPDEARHVYLQWAVRFAPSRLQVHLLRELRHIWRAERGWATGAWGLALVAAAAGWAGQIWAAVGLVTVVAGLGVRLTATDAAWIAVSLGVPPGRVLAARAIAVAGVAVPVAIAAGITLMLQRGAGGVPAALALLLVCLIAPAAAVRAGRAYVPLAILLTGCLAALLGVIS